MKKKMKAKKKRIETRGRPRRPDEELALEGRPREQSKKVKRLVKPRPIKFPSNLKTEGDRCIYFFRNYLKHTMGEWSERPFEPLPWQIEMIKSLLDTKNKDGTRQYRWGLLFVGRKNGKTVLSSGLLLYWLCIRSEQIPNLRIYSAATTKEQAGIIFDAASQMVQASPILSKMIRVIPRYKKLVNHRTRATYEALSGETSGKYGLLNSELIVFDELFEQRDIEYISALQKSQGAMREPLFLMLSTAGNDKESPLFDYYNFGKQIQEGLYDDPTFYFKCYEIPENLDWQDPKNWHLANPSMEAGVRKVDEIYASLVRALKIPREQNEFRQFYANQWVSSSMAWIPVSLWDKCFDPSFNIEKLKTLPCYMGVDLSETRDVTAVVILAKEGSHYYHLPFFWLPEFIVTDKAKVAKVPVDVWAREGHLYLSRGNAIDYDMVISKIKELAQTFNVKMIGVDPYNSRQVIIDLQKEHIPVETIAQGIKPLNSATKELERLVIDKYISHNGNSCMRWMVDNATIWRDSSGNIKVDKRSRTAKVDGVSATINALALVLDPAKQEVESILETEGLKFVSFEDGRVSIVDGLSGREVGDIKKCQSCGSEYGPHDLFCFNCKSLVIKGCPRHSEPERHPLEDRGDHYFCKDDGLIWPKPEKKGKLA